MGQSEVKQAATCVGRGASRAEYRVLYVTHALDQRRRRLVVLPNPLDPKHSRFYRFYRFPGTGLRCSFTPD